MLSLLAGSLVAVLVVGATPAPDYAVTATRRVGISPEELEAQLGILSRALAAHRGRTLGTPVPAAEFAERVKKAGARQPSTCAGNVECVATIGRAVGLARLVSTQFVQLGGELTVDAALVDVASMKVVSTATATVRTPARVDMDALAQTLLSSLPVTDAPVEAHLEPVPAVTPPPVLELRQPGLRAGRGIAIGLGAGAIVAVGAGVVMGSIAASRNELLRKTSPDFATQQAEVRSLAAGADVAYGVAGALAVGAVVVWLLTPTGEEGPKPTVLAPARGEMLHVLW